MNGVVQRGDEEARQLMQVWGRPPTWNSVHAPCNSKHILGGDECNLFARQSYSL